MADNRPPVRSINKFSLQPLKRYVVHNGEQKGFSKVEVHVERFNNANRDETLMAVFEVLRYCGTIESCFSLSPHNSSDYDMSEDDGSLRCYHFIFEFRNEDAAAYALNLPEELATYVVDVEGEEVELLLNVNHRLLIKGKSWVTIRTDELPPRPINHRARALVDDLYAHHPYHDTLPCWKKAAWPDTLLHIDDIPANELPPVAFLGQSRATNVLAEQVVRGVLSSFYPDRRFAQLPTSDEDNGAGRVSLARRRVLESMERRKKARDTASES